MLGHFFTSQHAQKGIYPLPHTHCQCVQELSRTKSSKLVPFKVGVTSELLHFDMLM